MSLRVAATTATATLANRLAYVLAVGMGNMKRTTSVGDGYNTDSEEEEEEEEGESGSEIEESSEEATLVDRLQDAISNKNVELVRELLEQGANPNEEDRQGWTAFTWAAASANGETTPEFFEIMKALVEGGADLNTTDGSGYTALMYAINTAESQVDDRIVRYLLESFPNADLNIENREGETAYEMAKTLQVKTLLENYRFNGDDADEDEESRSV